jgi:hypothetical protein
MKYTPHSFNIAAGELFKIAGTESAGANTWQKLWAWIANLPEAKMTTHDVPQR